MQRAKLLLCIIFFVGGVISSSSHGSQYQRLQMQSPDSYHGGSANSTDGLYGLNAGEGSGFIIRSGGRRKMKGGSRGGRGIGSRGGSGIGSRGRTKGGNSKGKGFLGGAAGGAIIGGALHHRHGGHARNSSSPPPVGEGVVARFCGLLTFAFFLLFC